MTMPDDCGQPGSVKQEGKEEIEVAVEEGHAEERVQYIILEGDERRADGKKQESPEDEQMHIARDSPPGA